MAEATGAPLVFEEVEGVGHVDGILKYDRRGQSEVQRKSAGLPAILFLSVAVPSSPSSNWVSDGPESQPEVAKTETEDYFVICQRVATGC